MNFENEELWQAMKVSKYRDTIKEVIDEMDGVKTFNDVLNAALDVVIKATHSQAGTLWFYDYFNTGKIIPKAYYGGKSLENISLNLGQGIAGEVIESGKPLIIADCQKDEHFSTSTDNKTGFDTKTMICVPLKHDYSNNAFGCIQIINKTDNTLFDEKDLEFAVNLADEFADYYIDKAGEKIIGFTHDKKLSIDSILSIKDQKDREKAIKEDIEYLNLDRRNTKELIKSIEKIAKIIENSKI